MKISKVFCAALFVLMTFSSSALYSQPPPFTQVSGRVLSNYGEPIGNARVNVFAYLDEENICQWPGSTWTGTTSTFGYYVIAAPSECVINVYVDSPLGYTWQPAYYFLYRWHSRSNRDFIGTAP